jgi:hypothetical protein
MFSLMSVPRSYKQDESVELVELHVEAGSNTSTVVLRVVGGEGNPVPGGITGPSYSWGI